MTMPIPGSEIFSSRPVDPDELARSLPSSLPTHTVTQEQVDALDPLTYEVIRHRLWSVTDEMGEALKRMSGARSTASSKARPMRPELPATAIFNVGIPCLINWLAKLSYSFG